MHSDGCVHGPGASEPMGQLALLNFSLSERRVKNYQLWFCYDWPHQIYMYSDVPAATWLVTPPLGMMNNLNVAIISTKLYFPFGGKWTGQGVFRQASRSKMRNRPIYHDKMDSRSPWSIITNICYSYTICTE